MRAETLPAAAFAAALASLPGCGPAALRRLLAAAPYVQQSWADLAAGRLPAGVSGRDGAARGWPSAAARLDVRALWRQLETAGIQVAWLGGATYPDVLAADPQPPGVLFLRGPAPLDRRPAVAVVGTRRCTGYGRDVARELGRELAAAGVRVVSGLALGIDGAAHEGALAADPASAVGVVASGLDVVYPRRHRRLWQQVGDAGVLVTEAPPGTRPEPWRFPQRNRVLAALADVVVVVESHARGGSLSTVAAALERGIGVMAVPGSVRSPASAGTNQLLTEGAAPATSTADVLVALSLAGSDRGACGAMACSPPATSPMPPLSADQTAVLAAVDWVPTPTETVLRRTGLGVGTALRILAELEVAGLVRGGGAWWERGGACSGGRG